jgi:thiamine-phosphate pyrophosphorylase
MTDERLGDRLWEALANLPDGAGGVVFRHYSLEETARLTLGREVAAIAEARNLTLAVAGSNTLAEQLGAQLAHNPDSASSLPLSLAVHNNAEAVAAKSSGASLAFVSPVFPTRSHPDRAALGLDRAVALAELAGCPAIALGGMSAKRFETLGNRFYGFAGIDCWLG